MPDTRPPDTRGERRKPDDNLDDDLDNDLDEIDASGTFISWEEGKVELKVWKLKVCGW